MGRVSRMRKKNPIIHRTQLFGGKKTAHEVHAEVAWNKKCEKCGGPPAIMIQSMAKMSDLESNAPEYLAAIATDAISRGQVNPDGSARLPTFPTRYGSMIRIARSASCMFHQKEAEIEAAQGPSWVLVHIDRGPGAETKTIQVQ